MNKDATLDRMFLALAHPARRAIVARLSLGPAPVAEAARGVRGSKPAISKHVKMLEEAGLVRRSVEGRSHRLRLEPAALDRTSGWLERQRALWEAKLDAVERHLAREDGAT